MRIASRAGLTLVALVAALAVVPAQAGHGTDDPNYVEHAGNGAGASAPLISGFTVHSALYNGSRFPSCVGPCASRPGMPKYLTFGLKNVVINGQSQAVLHVASLGDDGISAQTPQPTLISDAATGRDVPFTFTSPHHFFDVEYDANQQGGPFVIYYKAQQAPGAATETGHMRRAVSVDGINWKNETALTDVDPATPVVSPSRSSYGPTDVIIQSGAGISSTCTSGTLAANYPWNCKYVMVYSAIAPSTEHIAIAGSTNGLAFRGIAGTILQPGTAGAWDDNGVAMAKVLKRAGGYTMYYLGSRAPTTTCMGGSSSCFSLGVATSVTGVGWTRSLQNPIVASTRYDALGGAVTPSTLWQPAVLDDGLGHARLYLNRRGNAGERLAYLAYTAPTPPSCPSIRVSSPKDGYLDPHASSPIDVFLNDTLGTNVGVDLQTLSLTLDGAPVDGSTADPTIVGTHNNADLGKRVRVSRQQLGTLSSGSHTFTVSVADLDGNTCAVTTTFTVDTIAPQSVVSTGPSSPRIGLTNGAGTFTGSTTDVGTGLLRVRADVINPLGTVKSFHTSDASGWQVTKTNANSWSWVFVGPILDPHFALPGEYRVVFRGTDLAGNLEGVTAANSTTVLLL